MIIRNQLQLPAAIHSIKVRAKVKTLREGTDEDREGSYRNI